MRIKAICTDIDGTLLDKNRELSRRTRQAFAALPEDFPVILASSRMPSAMIHLLTDLKRENNPLVCYNGGYVLPASLEKNALSSVWIEPEVCQKIIAQTANTSIHVSLYSEDDWFAPKMDPWTKKEEKATKVKASLLGNDQVIAAWKKSQSGAHKVMCMGTAREIQELYQHLQRELSAALHLYRSKDTYLEIAPKSISKATGLREIIAGFGISMDEVMAFGDNYNDIDLLSSVGLGIAVGNARDEVKAVANEITAGNKADGVALSIEKYLL
ncbi:Cof-type HAD-IIB family hydrolase [Cyclobacterium jeungdonense]|uniref:Cof-type HAD-IIB family hydrolase n=1 Tax=Cyclobacterium jeungdonense TaxID=708087 RepID=A0ABT8C4G0_9BACT|nr:Cof-type HAD-IIB family hydrolase [Cyclobacterium jeungdonense]MDN3686952.1 Cof-type HAD-IIB family hydrolase [Cyclobacterium jeungdonense]